MAVNRVDKLQFYHLLL